MPTKKTTKGGTIRVWSNLPETFILCYPTKRNKAGKAGEFRNQNFPIKLGPNDVPAEIWNWAKTQKEVAKFLEYEKFIEAGTGGGLNDLQRGKLRLMYERMEAGEMPVSKDDHISLYTPKDTKPLKETIRERGLEGSVAVLDTRDDIQPGAITDAG